MEDQTQWELLVTNFILTRTRQLKFTAKDAGERGALFGAASPSEPVMASSSTPQFHRQLSTVLRSVCSEEKQGSDATSNQRLA